MRNQTFASVLFTSSILGLLVWAAVPGSFHAYFVSVDWRRWSPTPETFPLLLQLRPLVALIVFGLLLGFATQAAALVGGALDSQGIALFGPIAAGALVGAFQGYMIGTSFWGFSAEIALRPEATRILVGGLCGFVAAPLIMMASVRIRKRRS